MALDRISAGRLEQINQDLRRRAIPGIYGYAAMLAVVGFFSQFPSRHPVLFVQFAAIAILLILIRYGVVATLKHLTPAQSRRWPYFLAVVYGATGFTWGFLAAYVLYDVGYTNFDSYVVFCLVAFSAANVPHVTAPYPSLVHSFLPTLLVPITISSFAAGTADGRSFGAITLLGLAFSYTLHRQLAKDYRQKLDSTEALRTQALQFEEATRLAQDANEAKSQFLANISHELRTPMSGVIGMTSLALDTPLTADQHEFISSARSSAESLLTLLNDLLDLSKIEAGRVDLELRDFALAASIDETVSIFQKHARDKGIALTTSFDPLLPAYVNGDALRFRQIMVNLVGNAVKFTSQGGVAIRLMKTGGTREGIELSVEVSDTGIGIPIDQHEAIFEAFHQADASTTRRFGGTGLGLNISRRLAEVMGGTITCQSAPGEGSSFRLSVRFGTATSEPAAAPSTAIVATSPMRVLLAEDNLVNQRVAQAMMEKWGHTVTVVSNGRLAVEAAISSRYDVILMDLQMPEMGGADAAREIRRREAAGAGPRRPIHALTASVDADAIERCREAGMDGCLGKPFRPSDLATLLASVNG